MVDLYPIADAFQGQDVVGQGQQSQATGRTTTGNVYASHGTLGTLSIRGSLTIEPTGNIRSGQTAYNLGTGFWLAGGATPQFSIGDPAGDRLTYSAGVLTITGTLNATAGNIGGWVIGATTLTSASGNLILSSATPSIRAGQTSYNVGSAGFFIGGGATPQLSIGDPAGASLLWTGTQLIQSAAGTNPVVVTLAAASGDIHSGQTAYDTNTGFWLEGGATPKFSIGVGGGTGNALTYSAGVLTVRGTITATAGAIGGWVIGATTLTSATGTLVMSSAAPANIHAGQTNYNAGIGFWIEGGATPRLSIGDSGGDNLTYSLGVLTVTGRLNFGVGDYIDNDLIHFEVSGVYASTIEWKPLGWASPNPYTTINAYASTTVASVQILAYGTGNRRIEITGNGADSDAFTELVLLCANSVGNDTGIWLSAVGTIQLRSATSVVAQWATTNRALNLYGYLYPGTGTGTQSTRYIADGNASLAGSIYVGAHIRADRLYPGYNATRYLSDDAFALTWNGGNIKPGASAGLVIPLKAGAVVDGDFTNAVDGLMGYDTTNFKLYVRSGGTWRSSAAFA